MKKPPNPKRGQNVLQRCHELMPEVFPPPWEDMARELAEALREFNNAFGYAHQRDKAEEALQKFDALSKK